MDGVDQLQLEKELRELDASLQDETDRLKELLHAEATAEGRAKGAEARAYVRYRNAGSTQRDSEMKARIDAGEDMREFRLVSARVKATKELLATIRSRIDSHRTQMVNLRAHLS